MEIHCDTYRQTAAARLLIECVCDVQRSVILSIDAGDLDTARMECEQLREQWMKYVEIRQQAGSCEVMHLSITINRFLSSVESSPDYNDLLRVCRYLLCVSVVFVWLFH